MTKISLKSEKREVLGRKVKNLRKQGLVPANIFGKNIESLSITVNSKEFDEAFKKAGETQIIDLSGKPVLVSGVQLNPVSGEYLHIDFRQVDLKEAIKANVPVVLEGESPAEKQNLGTVVQQLDEVEVEALPVDLPEKIVVDQSVLTEVDQIIHVKDLKVSADVTILTDLESIVAKVEPPQVEEVETPVVSAEGDAATPASAEGETKTESQEAPAEEGK